jgi:hypothetical protein
MGNEKTGILLFDGIKEEGNGNEDDQNGEDAEHKPNQIGNTEKGQIAEKAIDSQNAEKKFHKSDHKTGGL